MAMLDSLERVLYCTFWVILQTLRASLAAAFNSHVGFTFQTLHKVAPHSEDSGTLGRKRDLWEALLQEILP